MMWERNRRCHYGTRFHSSSSFFLPGWKCKSGTLLKFTASAVNGCGDAIVAMLSSFVPVTWSCKTMAKKIFDDDDLLLLLKCNRRALSLRALKWIEKKDNELFGKERKTLMECAGRDCVLLPTSRRSSVNTQRFSVCLLVVGSGAEVT